MDSRPSVDAIYTYQSCDPDPSGTLTGWSWYTPPQISAAQAAREAFGLLVTPEFTVGFNPPVRAVVGVPTWLWAQTAQAGVTGNEAAARDLNETAQERTKLDLQIAVATALADSAHLPEGVRTDDAGKTYPWFAGGSFDEGVLKDPEMRNLFMQWLHDDSGDIAPLLTDASQAYDDGLVRGR